MIELKFPILVINIVPSPFKIFKLAVPVPEIVAVVDESLGAEMVMVAADAEAGSSAKTRNSLLRLKKPFIFNGDNSKTPYFFRPDRAIRVPYKKRKLPKAFPDQSLPEWPLSSSS